MNQRNGSRQRRRFPLLAIACAGALFWTAPALAGPQSPRSSESGTQAANATDSDHAMGSEIRKHEGGQPIAEPKFDASATVSGIDVSAHQGNVDWARWWRQNKRFAYIKATEGLNYKNAHFAQQYNGSYGAGMIRGAYHFALPNQSRGRDQANHFLASGGGWSRDGKTLPGALDIEYNPYGDSCYGLSKRAMTAWIKDFSDTYHARTGRWPVIYTSTNWWNACVDGDFSSTNPLWIARYADSPGPLPFAWRVHTFWQYTSSPVDQNTLNGSYERLRALANG